MRTVDQALTTDILIRALQGGSRPFLEVTSNSMSPLLRAGDEIQLTSINEIELEVGDIIVVGDDDGFLAHRLWLIFSINGSCYLLLRGDRIKNFDPPFPITNLIGRVCARRRKKDTLDLTQGIGRQLDLLLKRIAALAVPPPVTFGTGSDPDHSYDYTDPGKSNWISRRRIFGGLYYSAKSVTWVVDLLNQFQNRFERD